MGVRNLKKVTLKDARNFNIYDAIWADNILLVPDSIKEIEERLA
jgi:ribosomal protein L4